MGVIRIFKSTTLFLNLPALSRKAERGFPGEHQNIAAGKYLRMESERSVFRSVLKSAGLSILMEGIK